MEIRHKSSETPQKPKVAPEPMSFEKKEEKKKAVTYVIMHHIEGFSKSKAHLHQFHYNTSYVLAYNTGEGAFVPNVPDMTFTKEYIKGVIFPHSDPFVMTVDMVIKSGWF